MIDKLEELKKRYEEVERELSKPETVSDLKIYTKLNKEYKSLGKIVKKFDSYKSTLVGVEEAKEIIENERKYKKMSSIKNPFGDGKTSNRIINKVVTNGWAYREQTIDVS